MLLLGIDLGTSSVKVSVVEAATQLCIAAVNFSLMAIYMFFACVAVCSLVSLATAKPRLQQMQGLT
ncbi:MAG: hypothetical protein WAR78_10725 [Ferruginibacter sp.]